MIVDMFVGSTFLMYHLRDQGLLALGHMQHAIRVKNTDGWMALPSIHPYAPLPGYIVFISGDLTAFRLVS